ncbi:hypothetical protein ACFWGN_11915 [Oerskovia sp. NPDC060338]
MSMTLRGGQRMDMAASPREQARAKRSAELRERRGSHRPIAGGSR